MPSNSLTIINKDDFKIYVSCCKKELEQLKNESVNINDSFIFYDENEQTFNYLYLD
jgi:hypothetical protein